MNEIINKSLLVGHKLIPEMHFGQLGFTNSACTPFAKNKERKQKFKETGDSRYTYQNELDKTCLQHEMAYGGFKDLSRRIAADKVLRGKVFNIAKNPKYYGYLCGLASIVHNFFDEKSSDSGVKNKIMSNQELAEELQK